MSMTRAQKEQLEAELSTLRKQAEWLKAQRGLRPTPLPSPPTTPEAPSMGERLWHLVGGK